jgi:hypothetical protein
MQRSGLYHFNRPTNRLDHEPHILIDFVIAEPNYAVTARGKPLGSLRIMIEVLLLMMLRPVEFDDQPLSKADEIDDIRPKRRLSAKLVAVDLPSARVKPEPLLSACGLIAKATGKVALIAVAVHGGTL